MIPLLAYRDWLSTESFYTRILGFRLRFVEGMPHDGIYQVEFQNEVLELTPRENLFPLAIYVDVEDVDVLFQTFIQNGLDTSAHAGIPEYNGPVVRPGGIREFYVDDPYGNTLRFRKMPQSAK